jgi:stage V sporulation protein D (sporulation-specific penicillin-binding protein)
MNDKILIIQKRIMIFVLANLILFLIFIGRLGYIQLFGGDEIKQKAYDLWSREIPVEGQRGIIYDRNGKPIVNNIIAPTVALIPRQIEDKEEVTRFLSQVLKVSYDEMYEHVNKRVSVELIKPEGRKIDVKTAQMIIDRNLKGVYIVGDTTRNYIYDQYLAHVLGFVGIDNQGITGIEYMYEDYLMGEGGSSKYYVDARGILLDGKYGYYDAPTQGMDVYLTIDIELQILLEKALENANALYEPDQMLGVIMNPKNGEVLAMASSPSFSPANYQDYPQEIYNRNLPIWMTYEPGSTFKVVTYSAGIEEGVFELDEHFYDPGYRIVEDRRIKDWKAGGHGDQTFLEVIENSCNPGFMEIGERLGTETLFKYIKDYGFYDKTGIDLLGESQGILFNPKNVGPVELATSSFGQANSVTPIQLVSAFSAAINGGMLYKPYVLKEIRMPVSNELVHETEKQAVRRVISEETSEVMRYALESVVARGTGGNAFVDGYRIGGKTGTAQKPAEGGGYMANNYIVSFIGGAPMNDPELVVYVAIDNPKHTIAYGGVVAAPIVGDIMDEAFSILGIEKQPDQIEKEYRWGDVIYHEVPDLMGKTKRQLPPQIYYKYEYFGDGDTVIYQSPQPGTKIVEGGRILVYFN